MGWRDEDGRMNLYDQNDNLVLEVKDDGSFVNGSGLTANPFGGSLPVNVRSRWKSELTGATILTRFESGHGWVTASTPTGGSVNLNDTATQGPMAPQTVAIVNGTAGNGAIDKSGLTLDLTGKELLVWVKFDTQNGATDPGLIVYAGDSGLVNYYSWSLAPSLRTTESGWSCIALFTGAASITGTPAIGSIAKIRLRVNSGGAGTYTVRFGGVATKTVLTSTYPNGVVTFSFDDAGVSDYTLAGPTLAKYSYPATAFIIVDQLSDNGGGGPSALQYRQMQDELGWEIAGHAYTLAAHNTRYENLSDLGAAELLSLRNWLLGNGFPSESWASPGGTATTAVWVLARKYFNCHRSAGVSITNAGLAQMVQPVRPYNLVAPTWAAGNVAAIQTAIDQVKANGTWLIVNFHGVTTAASSGSNISTADLDTLAAYCSSQAVSVKTVESVLREASLAN